jgi:hypothetical protein
MIDMKEPYVHRREFPHLRHHPDDTLSTACQSDPPRRVKGEERGRGVCCDGGEPRACCEPFLLPSSMGTEGTDAFASNTVWSTFGGWLFCFAKSYQDEVWYFWTTFRAIFSITG